MKTRIATFLIAIVAILPAVFTTSIALASDRSVTGDDLFEKHVRPLLIERCFECHSEDYAESGLRMDSLSALLRGGERGPAIVPGRPDESLLISAVRHGELLKMPPKSKLTAVEVARLEQWIELGAPWPGSQVTEAAAVTPPVKPLEWTEEQQSHWAFQPLTKPTVPKLDDASWVQTPVDAFVLSRLRAAGLSPAPPASKQTLIRRLTFDLIGLPPTPDEIDRFLADDSADAYSRLVDRLLASPRYGERWGRHWLDLARYADSNGLDENLAYANAFRYRDYVISSFNRDKPFNRFATEQLAGDLLITHDQTASQHEPFESLIATGFLSLGAKMLAEDDPVKMQMDIVDEQVDTIGRVFLGMTFGCARCHDHKFDPISAADYYALAGILKSTKTMETHTVVARWLEQPLASSEQREQLELQRKAIAQIDQQLKQISNDASKNLLDDARRHLADYLIAVYRAELIDSLIVQSKPLGDDAARASEQQAILVEAEDYVRGNVLKDTANYGAGIGVLVNRGEMPNFAEYEIEVPHAGYYQIELRYAAADPRPTMLLINGELVKGDAAARSTGSWNPDGQKWHLEGIFSLDQGRNVLRLEQQTAFPHIDKVLIAAVPRDLNELLRATSTGDYKTIPEWVQQWRHYLAKSSFDLLPSLAAWQKTTRPETKPNSEEVTGLARSIGTHAQRVLEDWQRALAADPKATSLADAADESLRTILLDSMGPFSLPTTIDKHYPAVVANEIAQLKSAKSEAEAKLPKFPEAMSVAEHVPQDLRIHIRGSHLTLGAVVERGFPRVLSGSASRVISPGSSGRRELAEWLFEPQNPLTARTMANRVWQWHFGEGLVRSSDNFGLLGQRPTHPELLDWLAVTFVESGWSLKELHRLLVSSSTYQMSSPPSPESLSRDAENLLWSRFARRRVEAEVVRDAILAATGQLDAAMGGTLLATKNREYVTSTTNVNPVIYESNRRSVYLPIVRSALYEVFQAFDFADPSVSQGKRESTTVAPQALFMMNSKVVSSSTRALAEELKNDSSLDDKQRVEQIFRRALGRHPSDRELQKSLNYLRIFSAESAGEKTVSGEAEIHAWQSLCRAVLSTNEFLYVE